MSKFIVLLLLSNTVSSNINEINCTLGSRIECGNHGQCIESLTSNSNSTQCICDDFYVSDPRISLEKCTYNQKRISVAVYIEFFLGIPFGAGFFYLELNGQGMCRFFVFLIFIICSYVMCRFTQSSKTTKRICISIGALIISIVWINDLISISNGILDGNGFPVSSTR